MRSWPAVVLVVTGLALACSHSPSAPSGLSLAGTWSGPGANMLGRHTISMTVAQSGSALSGTVQTRAADPLDGTCSSCHMNKLGTVTGTITGSTVSLDMVFPSGNQAEPTPLCSATMSVTASGVTATQIGGAYTGSDTCEGPWIDATLTMTRQ